MLTGSVRYRVLLGVAVLSAVLLVHGDPTPAHAALGTCAGDPIVVLSNGVAVDLSATVNDDLSDVQQITYILHAPAGTHVVAILSLGPREVLHFVADNTPVGYDSVTRVSTYTPGVAVTALTSVVPLAALAATGSASGTAHDNLAVHLSV